MSEEEESNVFEDDVTDDQPERNKRCSITPFHTVAASGILTDLADLLKSGADVNAVIPDHITPLHLAALECHLEYVGILLAGVDLPDEAVEEDPSLYLAAFRRIAEITARLQDQAGASDFEDRLQEGYTPLHWASREGHTECVKLLLSKGANIEQATKSNRRALGIACFHGHHEIASILLDRGADVNPPDEDGFTALRLASVEGHLQCVQLLLSKGANVDAETKRACTPLHLACFRGHAGIASSLLDHGAATDHQTPEGYSALHWASREGHIDCVKLLVSKGANIELETEGKFRALELACYNGHHEVASLLLEKGTIVDHKDEGGVTALHMASMEGHLHCVQLLLSYAADITSKTDKGYTPIDLASYGDQEDVAAVLIEHEAILDNQTVTEIQPIHLASYFGHVEYLKLLFRKGTDFEAETKNGHRPLQLATLRGHSHVVRALLDQGADVNQGDKSGNQPLHVACMEDRVHIAELLLTSGADIFAKNNSDETPLHYARQLGDISEIYELISKDGLIDGNEEAPTCTSHEAEYVNEGEKTCVESLGTSQSCHEIPAGCPPSDRYFNQQPCQRVTTPDDVHSDPTALYGQNTSQDHICYVYQRSFSMDNAAKLTENAHKCLLQDVPTYQKNIKTNIKILANYMDFDEVKRILYGRGILPQHVVQISDNLPVGEVRKSARLLTEIANLTPKNFCVVEETLRQNGQTHLADLIRAPAEFPEPEHWGILQSYHKELRTAIDAIDASKRLLEQGIISLEEKEHIQTGYSTVRRADLLLAILRRKTPDQFQAFCVILSKCNPGHIAELLQKPDK